MKSMSDWMKFICFVIVLSIICLTMLRYAFREQVDLMLARWRASLEARRSTRAEERARLAALRIADEASKAKISPPIAPGKEAAKPKTSVLKPKPIRYYDILVSGVQYDGRQKWVKRCHDYESLVLRKEPDNPRDRNAIAIDNVDGHAIGYVPREMAKEMMRNDSNGTIYSALVKKLIPESEDTPFVRIAIYIFEADEGVSHQEIYDFIVGFIGRSKARRRDD